MTDIADKKRTLIEDNEVSSKKQKTKGSKATIPILLGRFKQRYLSKHSSLLKRSDEASGMMVSCNVNGETRALGQVFTCLDKYINILFPEHESTWTRYEGPFDIDDDVEERQDVQKDRKEKKVQAVDVGCGGFVFYRFRINVKPTEFLMKMMEHIKTLPEEERKQEIHKLRYCKRWLPLDYICPAVTERIGQCFERIRDNEFKDISDEDTVAILIKINNNIMITREEIINTIAPLIPPKYKIDLKKPTWVIYVTVFKSVCGMSIYKEYYERMKYNLISYCEN